MTESNQILRLNKFVAKSGVCNRKEAVALIKKGSISVNGAILLEPFYEVKPTDVIVYKGKILVQEQNYLYLLLNKPKDVGAEENKLQNKPSISDLIKKLTDQPLSQLFPIEDTSAGLTILSNDTELIRKLNDKPKKSKIVFEIELDKPMDDEQLTAMSRADQSSGLIITGVARITNKEGNHYGIELAMGTDTNIKQLLSELGFDVLKIDRTFMNGLTKKDLKRGWSRLLTPQEVIFLKYF
jgi:23S rRNA pseudouridine2605 synthase